MPQTHPPSLLVQGRRLPGNGETIRRMLRAVDLQPGERVLLVGAAEGEGLKLLAREFGAQVTALEWEPRLAAALEAKVREESLAGRVAVRQVELDSLPKASFDVVVLETLPPSGEIVPFA